ncbi:hypothetical protein ACIQD1_22100 [Streptomyces sp. NPDC093088]|uniref:hypothetical protein n=1 Tax=Streptomyces sp. NPDC093088 TaxID=3366023 RepID=UPI0038051A28
MTTPRARRAVTVTAATLLLWEAGATLAYSADTPDTGGLLGPLNVQTSEGAPLDRYELDPIYTPSKDDLPGTGPTVLDVATTPTGGVMDSIRQVLASGLFALARTVTGFACWLIDWAYRFPVMDKLASPAQKLSDAYDAQIIGPLGLAGICLAWAFVFGLVTIMRGRFARGAGEILLTLLIAGISATAVVQPAMFLGYNGPVQQTQRAALEAATITANSGQLPQTKTESLCDSIVGPARDVCLRNQPRPGSTPAPKPDRTKQCSAITGPARDYCLKGERPLNAADVSKPITRTLSDTLVVQPYMLLQYGRIIEKDSPLYPLHKNYVTPPPAPKNNPCGLLVGPAREHCELGVTEDDSLYGRAQEFEKHGADGIAIAAHMQKTDWNKVLGAALVLLAALIITLIIFTMAMALIAAQFGCVIAAIGTMVVLTLSLLPGPARGLLWRWAGYLAGSMLTLFAIAVFIPLFGVGARALLADNSTPLLERLFLLDGLAVTALVLNRRIIQGTSRIGQRMALHMRFSKVGGSHTMDDTAAATAAAFSSLGYQGGAPGSPAHAALLSRQAGPAGRFAGEALAEGRRALMPLSIGMRAAHTALIGPKRLPVRPEPVGPDGLPLPPSHRTAPGRPGTPGPEETARPPLVPAGSRLEASLRRTRAGRVLVGTTKTAFYSTVGLPATWTRVRRFGSTASQDLHTELGRQRAHYRRVANRWLDDSAAAFPPRPRHDDHDRPEEHHRTYRPASTEPPRPPRTPRPPETTAPEWWATRPETPPAPAREAWWAGPSTPSTPSPPSTPSTPRVFRPPSTPSPSTPPRVFRPPSPPSTPRAPETSGAPEPQSFADIWRDLHGDPDRSGDTE